MATIDDQVAIRGLESLEDLSKKFPAVEIGTSELQGALKTALESPTDQTRQGGYDKDKSPLTSKGPAASKK